MKLIITDLDNTLYDWVTYFAKSLDAMIDVMVARWGMSRETILDEFRALNREHGDSERPFSVLELPSVEALFPGRDFASRRELLAPALDAFNAARRRHLCLYDGVLATLQELKRQGVSVVGHTEANAVNAYYRIRTLEIAGYFDHLLRTGGKTRPPPDSWSR